MAAGTTVSPETTDYNDYSWLAPSMFCVPLLIWLAATVIHALSLLQSRLYAELSVLAQRKFVANFLELVLSVMGFILGLAFGFDILFHGDVAPDLFAIVRGLVI